MVSGRPKTNQLTWETRLKAHHNWRITVKHLTLCFCIVFLATACGAGFHNNKSRSTIEYDDGVNKPRRVTVTHQGKVNAGSIGIPMVGPVGGAGAGFYGAGYGVMGGDLCSVHRDACSEVVVTQHVGDPNLEKRVAVNEKRIKNLGGAYRVMIDEGRKTNARVSELEKQQKVLIKWGRRSYYLDQVQCTAVQKDLSVIKDEKLRTTVTKACNELLGADATGEGGNS